jgi:hypothetical protein
MPASFLTDNILRKRSSEFFDPCQDFANQSIKCLRRNGGDKEMCTDYFQYVHPALPLAIERPTKISTVPGTTIEKNLYIELEHLLTQPTDRAYRDCKREWVCVVDSTAESCFAGNSSLISLADRASKSS